MIPSHFIWKSQFAFCFQIISCVHSLHLEMLPVRIIWSKVNGVLEDFLPDLDLGISQLLDNQCNDMTWVDETTHGHCTTIWSENWSKDLTAGRLTLTSTLTLLGICWKGLLRICWKGPSLTHCQTGHDRGFCRQQTAQTFSHLSHGCTTPGFGPLLWPLDPTCYPHGVHFGQVEQIFNAFSVPPCTMEQAVVLQLGCCPPMAPSFPYGVLTCALLSTPHTCDTVVGN